MKNDENGDLENSLDNKYITLGEEVGKSKPNSKGVGKMTLMLWGLIAFIISWCYYAVITNRDEVDDIKSRMVYLDGVPTNVIANYPLFTSNSTGYVYLGLTNPVTKVSYVHQTEYEVGDTVTIKYFNLSGVVIAKKPSKEYTVLYKDHNNTLQKIDLKVDFLMKPLAPQALSD